MKAFDNSCTSEKVPPSAERVSEQSRIASERIERACGPILSGAGAFPTHNGMAALRPVHVDQASLNPVCNKNRSVGKLPNRRDPRELNRSLIRRGS
jgi:hypothetical protein